MDHTSILQMENTTKEDSSKRFKFFVLSLIVILALISSVAAYVYCKAVFERQDLNSYEVLLKSYSQVENGTMKELRDYLMADDRISKAAIFRLDSSLVWPLQENWVLSADEKSAVSELISSKAVRSWVRDELSQFIDSPGLGTFIDVVNPNETRLVTVTVISDDSRSPQFVVKSLRDYSQISSGAMLAALGCFVLILLSSFLVYTVTFRLFRRNIQTIKDDEDYLNEQVLQLSSLLEENKTLQRNMKTASSRAVELNERFLRRVGADLHDGPAQSIGYAVLRLNQVNSKEISEKLGHEFHAVKEALNESLEEIRGISSGLVLPELEKMSLEEAVRKVIERHKMKTGTEVKEDYFNLPDDISLPIKICAYRFAQEGLNNAYKHGNAEKCRFTAQVINDVLHLSLKDNGMGFRKSVLNTDGGHLGLVGLKDRIESLGGKLNINSELGVGTAIKVSVKLSSDD